ncbi:MAG: hypothetical protein ACE5JX_20775 [Acidobacteriota bacterium]
MADTPLAELPGRGSGGVAAINGRSPGFTSYLERYLDDDACIIILSNNYAPAPFAMIDGLSAILFGEPYTRPSPARPVELSRETLDAYQGSYRFGSDFYRPGVEVKVLTREGYLSIEWGPGYSSPLLPVSRTEFLDRRFWATITFTRDREGRVTGFTWKDPDTFQAERLSH